MKNILRTMWSLIVISTFCAAASWAQPDRLRTKLPSGRVVDQPEHEATVGRPADPPVRYQPSAEQKNLTEAEGIRDVKISPHENAALFNFRARAGSLPTIEFGLERPTATNGGKLQFPTRLGIANAEVVVDKKALTQTHFMAVLNGLEKETRYYYIITAPASDRTGERQIQGHFKTVTSRYDVVVAFKELKVTNDSDDGGNGELFFRFITNNKESRDYGTPQRLLSWNDRDPARSINEVFELSDVGGHLQIGVNGYDDDDVLPGMGLDPGDNQLLNAPFGELFTEGNVAKQAFNLAEFAGKGERVDFTIHSMPHASGQGDLSFVVKGYIEVRRR